VSVHAWEFISEGLHSLNRVLQVKTGMRETRICLTLEPSIWLVPMTPLHWRHLFPNRSTCRIVMTSHDRGLDFIIGLDLGATSPLAAIYSFHSTRAGYSFHCPVVSRTKRSKHQTYPFWAEGSTDLDIARAAVWTGCYGRNLFRMRWKGIESDFADYINHIRR
jgi:hypothetical protein